MRSRGASAGLYFSKSAKNLRCNASEEVKSWSAATRSPDNASTLARMSPAPASSEPVWGTGVKVIYPKENKSLAEQILAGGGPNLSELPLGTFPAPHNFPKRNREVFAVPGNVTTKHACVPNLLIKQGAKLVSCWEDVREKWPTQVRIELEQGEGFASEGTTESSLFEESLAVSAAEARVLGALRRDEALQTDEILEKLESEMSSPEVFTALFELELASRIRQLPGKNYVKSF
jgi:DNA processing protein